MPQEIPGHMPAWSHPIRIPSHIGITHTHPPFAIAGETSTWRLPFVLSGAVSKGCTLTLQVAGGRNNKGLFSCSACSAALGDGSSLGMTSDESGGTYLLSVPDTGLQAGDALTVTFVDCKAPRIRQLNKFFVLHIGSPKVTEAQVPRWAGGSVWAEGTDDRVVAACTMHILGGRIDHLHVYVPSSTMPREEFSVLIRPEDAFHNLSCEKPGELSICLNDQETGYRLEDVQDSTCVRALVAVAQEGTHRLCVRETDTGRNAAANPTVCGAETNVYWGMIHGHTEMSDGTGTLEQYFHQLRNEVALDFAAPGDHDHSWETPQSFWDTTCDAVRRWHEPGRFVTFLGYEWAKWRRNGDGDRNVYYLADNRPMYRSDDDEYPSPPDLFGALARNKERAIVIPHHTGHGGNFCDWKDHDPASERLVEIFQMRGGYECSARNGNPVPERGAGAKPHKKGYVRGALALGWRVGFTAGGDDHVGCWGTESRFDSGYGQGLMSVEASERSREAIFAAMYNRRVVATTGARMLLTYRLNGYPMGSELSVSALPELADSRKLSVEFHGTAAIDRIDIIRNNSVVYSTSATDDRDLCLTWEDCNCMDSIWLPTSKFCTHPFAFYYVRAVQQDDEVAWASPVWIDP